MSRLSLLLFAAGCIFFFADFDSAEKSTVPIILHDEKFNFTPHEFYIADVEDERSDRSSVASLKDKGAPQLVDLKGGAATAIKQFTYRNLHRDTALRAVTISLKEFKLSETNLPGGRVSGRLGIVFWFALHFSDRTLHR